MEQNRSKRRVSRIMAAMLAIVLCLTTSLTALAGTGGTAANPQKAILTKNLRYATGAGLSTPTANFTYTFTEISLDGSTAPADLAAMPTPAASISFSSSDTSTTVAGMEQVTKTADVLSGLTWTRTGVYEYHVVENTTGFTPGAGENMIFSQAEFTLYVVIAYDSVSGTYFPEITYTQQTKLDDGSAGGSKGDPNKDDITNTTYNFSFNNIFTKVGGSTPGTDALKITKTTTGTGSDPSKPFSFTLTADDTPTGILVPGGTYTGTLTQGGVATTVSFTADGTAYSFTLASGDSLVIDNALAGTSFEVKETGVTGYIPSYTGTVGNNVAISATGTLATDLATGSQIIGAINNEVDYTNAYGITIPTGILNNVIPAVALLAVVVLGFIAFAAMNRRKASR